MEYRFESYILRSNDHYYYFITARFHLTIHFPPPTIVSFVGVLSADNFGYKAIFPRQINNKYYGGE